MKFAGICGALSFQSRYLSGLQPGASGQQDGFTFYINALLGNDANDGRHPGSPKRTLAAIAALSLDPGSSIGLARGCVWQEELVVTRSGTSDRPIVVGAYGTGPAPVVDAADDRIWRRQEIHQQAAAGSTFWSANQTTDPEGVIFGDGLGTRVSDLLSLRRDRQWFWDSHSGRLHICYAGVPDRVVTVPARVNAIVLNGSNNVILRDLHWKGARREGLVAIGQTNGIVMDHCVGELCLADGAFFPQLDAPHDEGRVTHSEFRLNGGSGFRLDGSFAGWSISDSEFHHNGLLPDNDSSAHTWTAGLKLWGNRRHGSGSIVERCIAHNNGSGLDDDRKGLGIWVDQAIGVTLRFNCSYQNDSWGIYLEKTKGSVAHHNLIWKCAQTAKYTAGLGVKCSEFDDSRNNGVFNNVVYDSGYWGLYLGAYEALGACRFDRNRVFNNIVAKSGSQVFCCDIGADNDGRYGSDNQYSANCFGTEYPGFASWAGKPLNTYAELNLAFKSSLNSVPGDPGFRDVAKSDFHLLETSPCRGRGVAIPGITTNLPTGKPDLGRY